VSHTVTVTATTAVQLSNVTSLKNYVTLVHQETAEDRIVKESSNQIKSNQPSYPDSGILFSTTIRYNINRTNLNPSCLYTHLKREFEQQQPTVITRVDDDDDDADSKAKTTDDADTPNTVLSKPASGKVQYRFRARTDARQNLS
jgi:hypothetical protein